MVAIESQCQGMTCFPLRSCLRVLPTLTSDTFSILQTPTASQFQRRFKVLPILSPFQQSPMLLHAPSILTPRLTLYNFYLLEYALDILENFPDCGTLNIPCIFQRFYIKSYVMYPKHILGIFQIVESKILITNFLPEIHQKMLNIQEHLETKRF